MRTLHFAFSLDLLNDGEVFAAGGARFAVGQGGIASIEEYHPATGKWRALSNTVMTPRYEHTGTTLLDGSILIAGGFHHGFWRLHADRRIVPDAPIGRAGLLYWLGDYKLGI